MTIKESEQYLEDKLARRKKAQASKADLADRGATSDKHLWYVWMGLMIVAVALLPFIVREGAVVRALADMCMTALGL